MLGYLLWLLAGVVLGVWVTPRVQTLGSRVRAQLRGIDPADPPALAPDDDPSWNDPGLDGREAR